LGNVKSAAVLIPVEQLHRRPHIVVVEDDSSLLDAVAFALEAEGFRVHAYTSAKALLLSPVKADCMVIDLTLPDGDGLGLIRSLRDRGILAPAILTTTHPTGRTRRAAAAAGVEIVEKPLITDELLRRIQSLVDGNIGGSGALRR
jgi:two-component system response regulator FixJ